MIRRLLAACGIGLLLAGPLAAQDLSDHVTIHGFASWGYGRTNVNNYLTGTEDGNYRQGQFSLNATAALGERLTVVAQPSFSQGAEEGVSAVSLDYAFAQWKVSDALKIRMGKVQQPFGIYTEILKVGTLRPFFSLPQSLYGPSGMATDGLTGVGLSVSSPAGKPWGVTADVYGGGIDLTEFLVPIDINRGDTLGPPEDLENEVNRDVVGLRVVVRTPVPGLSVGGSAFTGVAEEGGVKNRNTVFGFQAEYLTDVWSVRAEYAHDTEGQKYIINAGYVEAAYRITPQWQVAARWDRFQNSLPGFPSPIFPALIRHRDWAAGVAYWLNPNLVLKAAYHDVSGNRFAGPDVADYLPQADAGTLNPKTHLVEIGAQFSY
jgi:hypothetical protein